MFNKLLYFITGYLHCRVICVNGKPYLERYYIAKNIYIHRFVSADGDRHVHDHPWDWAFSLILLGSYMERLNNDDKVKRTFFNYIPKYYFHQIILVSSPTWTLFCHGKRFKNTFHFLSDDNGLKEAKQSINRRHYKTYPAGRFNKERSSL